MVFLFLGVVSASDGFFSGLFDRVVSWFSDKDVGLSPLNEQDQEVFVEARALIQESDGHDYSILYELVESKRDVNSIKGICERESPLHCYKWASKNNPPMRKEICEEMRKALEREYGDKINVQGHFRECELGIPQMVW